MIFQGLSKDIIQEIFEFDPTYKDTFSDVVLKTLVTPRMRVLQSFLDEKSASLGLTDEHDFEAMKHIHVNHDDKYIEIRFQGNVKTMFYVMTLEEKDFLDDTTDKKSPMVLRQILYRLPSHLIAPFTDRRPKHIETIQERYNDDKETCNKILYELLGSHGYERMMMRMIENGTYNKEVHKFLFCDYFNKIDDLYFIEDQDNYHYFEHDNRHYVVYWNIYTNSLFL